MEICSVLRIILECTQKLIQKVKLSLELIDASPSSIGGDAAEGLYNMVNISVPAISLFKILKLLTEHMQIMVEREKVTTHITSTWVLLQLEVSETKICHVS